MLEKHLQLAINAHNNTSFSPERRGAQIITDAETEIAEDMAMLKTENIADEIIAGYCARYEKFFTAHLYAKSRCISSMITGPAKFPIRRAEKANRSEENHYKVFREWRTRAIKAIIRKSKPIKTIDSELERYRTELKSLEALQEQYKAINKAFKAFKKNPETLDKTEFSDKIKTMIRNYVPAYSWEPNPIAPFQLSNLSANIRRVAGKIIEFERKEQRAATGNKEFSFSGGVIILNYEIDRVQIKHDTKPERTIIDALKHGGFHWTPSAGVWQRQISRHAFDLAKQITGYKPEEIEKCEA